MPEQSAGGKRRPSFRLWGAKKPADGGGGAAHTRHALLVVQTQEAAARQQLATQCAQAAARLARGRPNRSAAGGVEVELHTPPAAVPAGTPTAGSPLCVSTPPPVLLRSPSTIAEAPSPAATPFTPGDPPETRVRRIFDAFDGDGDGRWAFEDVRVWGMVCMGSITTRGDYAALCARVGADLEGGLALRHVVEWYARDFDARAVDAHYAACVALERATPPAEVHLPPRPSSQLRAKSYHAPPTPPLAHLTPPNVPRRTPSPPSPGTPSRAISRRGSHVPPRERPVLPVTPLSAPPSWHGGCRTCFDDGGGDAIELVELRPTAAARPEAPMPGPGPSARLGSAPPEASVVCRPLFTDAPGVEAEAEAEGVAAKAKADLNEAAGAQAADLEEAGVEEAAELNEAVGSQAADLEEAGVEEAAGLNEAGAKAVEAQAADVKAAGAEAAGAQRAGLKEAGAKAEVLKEAGVQAADARVADAKAAGAKAAGQKDKTTALKTAAEARAGTTPSPHRSSLSKSSATSGSPSKQRKVEQHLPPKHAAQVPKHGARSGMKCDPEVHEAFADMQTRGGLQGFEMMITYDTIVVGKTFERGTEYSALINHAAGLDDGRYFFWNFEYKSDMKVPGTKRMLILFTPEELDAKTKVLYASSKDAVKRALKYPGILEIETHDLAGLDPRELLDTFPHECH
eukprot:TRINITY_DN1147_c2_g1_i2.p1 TRINITY_DN1147_c2_g1~~TRINITY_DN1147_c2_g1_i2.p1  ORF type:complete len:684 (+),score=215.72 TRINITY_DN1147_c2_g1_i2:58-2109(+)